MKAVCASGVDGAANHHLLGLTRQLPTRSECRWNTKADKPFILTPMVTASYLSATGTGVHASWMYPRLISTTESWGQSEPRLMRGGESDALVLLSPWRGIILPANRTDVWDRDTSHVYVCACKRESCCLRTPVMLSPICASYYRSPFSHRAQMWQHVAHIRENWYKKHRGSEAELPQWSWHLSVLKPWAAALVGEKPSDRCHCWTFPGQSASWLARRAPKIKSR